jgi:hypothetical protein
MRLSGTCAVRHAGLGQLRDDVGVSIDLGNYELLWPAALFNAEGGRVLRGAHRFWEERAIWLMTEALAGSTAAADFEELPNHSSPGDDPWASPQTGWGKQPGRDKREWFAELVKRADEIRQAVAPRAYGHSVAAAASPARAVQQRTHAAASPESSASSRTRAIWSRCSVRTVSTTPMSGRTPQA